MMMESSSRGDISFSERLSRDGSPSPEDSCVSFCYWAVLQIASAVLLDLRPPRLVYSNQQLPSGTSLGNAEI